MTAVTGSAPEGAGAEPRRAGRELLLEGFFRPLAGVLVPPLRRLGVPPPAVVLANAAAGLAAALAIAAGQLVAAALLLQVKTLLDNADGQLARVTERVTLTGRYLDTVADLAVNAALFAALGYATRQPALAAAGFVALTLVLALDFNVSEVYRERSAILVTDPTREGRTAERVLERVYEIVLGPLDRAARRLLRTAEIDRTMLTVLANLGLTTQLAVLGVALALGAPDVYPWLAVACAALAAALLVRARLSARPRRVA